ncbi:succinate-semialdehyde dehydrogenase [Pseudoclavibacter sp. RFBJ3]|nr:succinate-semialdehyde dehydrogenase [Pseudoclavibacter sp. RFBJ5]PPF95227.1 succinate-semialdehyde dehydrogenase [Pseudoclavibacter sp. RFBJ3]PPF97661.1 succinate-semialdehyde dehydrogenase [Pseudoclavibacter sp. RFBH5]PPG22686.1 succinate-semialdehyde dehydrogenase [Pseudoclavibacter sp. RFBI4]
MSGVSLSTYVVVNPATGEQGQEFPLVTSEGIETALQSLDGAYRTWSKPSTVAERAALMSRAAELHRERREALAEIITREMGKPIEQSYGEVDFSADILQYYADNAESFLKDAPIELLGGEGTALIRRSALGPLLGIMPWNFPFYQVARFAGPNLVLGNPILLKHAGQCPESATALQQIFADAGFPEGAYVNIFATNEQIADIIADDRIHGVSLTGSERAGAAVAEIAGRNLKKVVLELGGSDPFILLSTDSVDEAVEAAVAARLDNSGQACNGAKRMIVIDSLYDEFAEKFTAAMTSVAAVDPTKDDSELGPLSSAPATKNLAEQVERAVAQGAQLLAGGGHDGNFFESTVLAGVTPDNDAYTEEFFGPVAALYKVSSEEEAIELANATPFGLGSYLFTTDQEQAQRVADAIEAGMVYINGVGLDSPELPFGGVKRSGFGRELGSLGIEEFVNKKLIRQVK